MNNSGYYDGEASESTGCLRGCLVACISPAVGVGFGVWYGINIGVWNGILGGLGAFVLTIIVGAIVSTVKGKLTYVDCVIPFIVSVVCAVVFAPIALFTVSFFSWTTCMAAGLIFTNGLVLYKRGRIHKGWLILPALSFMYECLPVDLPTDLDNVLAVGGSALCVFGNAIKHSVTSQPGNDGNIE